MKKVILLLMLGLFWMIPIKVAAQDVIFLTDSEQSQASICKADRVRNTNVEVTYEEAQLLMKLARSEAGDLGQDAMLIVMNVVINRRNDDRFPDNIHDIVYAEGQFSVVTNGEFDKADINPDTHIALARLEMGEDISDGALYFESSSATETWQSKHLEFVSEKLGQRFYK